MNTRVNLAGVLLKNPIMTASGTFGSGQEYSEFVDLNKLGAVVTKGVANVPWPGNPTPRVAEVYGGMLNAIGLQNPGIDVFVQRDIPFLTHYDTRIIVNVCGKTASDYIEVVERLAEQPVDMLEINISCPNVKEGGIAFGQNAASVEEITKEVKKYAKQPVIMKLSPNVTDITEMAKAAEAGGADVILIPEIPYDINKVVEAIQKRNKAGKRFTILAVAEGAISKEDAELPKKKYKEKLAERAKKYPSVSYEIADQIQQVTGSEVRITVPGHMQRGGEPCAYDRVLSTRIGAGAAQAIMDEEYGVMIGVINGKIKRVPLAECAGKLKMVSPKDQLVKAAKQIGISFGD